MPVVNPRNIVYNGNELLAIQDVDGKIAIKIKPNGDIELAHGLNTDDAVLEFWKSVADFIPTSEGKNIQGQVFLIKAYAILKVIQEKRLNVRLSQEENDAFQAVVEEIYDNFYRI